MLLVETSNPEQKQQLEEQFSLQGNLYQVPPNQSFTVAALLRTATYHLFHSSSSHTVVKFQQFALRVLAGVVSLDLYREALGAVQEEQERASLYQEYIMRMNEAFEEAPISTSILASPLHQQNLDELLEEANCDHQRSVSLLEMPEVPMLRLDSARDKQDCADVQSELTKHTVSSGKKISKDGPAVARLSDFFSPPSDYFYSPSAVYSREDWRTEREPKDSSREIESFKKRGSAVIDVNESLQDLLTNELAYDLRRQALENAPGNRELQQLKIRQERYNRKIKEAIIFSKIGLRKRK